MRANRSTSLGKTAFRGFATTALMVATLVALDGPAYAVTTVGGHRSDARPMGCSPGDIVVQNNYVIPSGGGRIVSFGYKPMVAQSDRRIAFKVLRPTGSRSQDGYLNDYTVIGTSGVQSVDGPVGQVQEFQLPNGLPVRAGDVLGLWSETAAADCRYDLSRTRPAPVGEETVITSANEDPDIGAHVYSPVVYRGSSSLNTSAALVQEGASGQGDTTGNPSNAFSINAFADGSGTLTYVSPTTGRRFDGQLNCVRIEGNSATLVARDPSTGRMNRTFIQDNGSTGDKLINTMFDPTALSTASAAKASACVTPDIAALGRARPLAGDAIFIGDLSASNSPQAADEGTR